MIVSRRNFLAGAASFAVIGSAAGPIVADEPPILRAAPGTARLAPGNYPETSVWSYDDNVPGPMLRVPQGGRISRRFVNALDQPATVHWHGIRITNDMDGVPDLTQVAVTPGGDFTYDFVPPDAGTYWYHPHNQSWEQMARGLYGGLIVEEANPPVVDRDEMLLVDDWRLTEDAQIDESFGLMMDWSHAGRLGNWITVNGSGDHRLPVAQGERLRLRLVNTANARIFSLSLRGLDGWVVALDGQPLQTVVPAGQVNLGPAQRVDLIVDVLAQEGTQAGLLAHDRDAVLAISTFDVAGIARTERLPQPTPLPANPVRDLGHLESALRVTLHMEGGAMGMMRGAMMGGRRMSMRGLADAGLVWAFNGVAGMPAEPLVTAARGETVRIEMINDSGWPHAMHLHGHHFRRIGTGGAVGPLRDTLMVERGETADIAFVADNPGDWLLHCHMLEHSVAGMQTWLRVIA